MGRAGVPADARYDVGRVWVLGPTLAIVIAMVMEAVMGLFGRKPTFTRIAVQDERAHAVLLRREGAQAARVRAAG